MDKLSEYDIQLAEQFLVEPETVTAIRKEIGDNQDLLCEILEKIYLKKTLTTAE